MKKLLALLMAAVMVFALCACGGGDKPAANAGSGDALEISFSTTFQETATGGELVTYFADQVKELSGGAVTVKVYYGGTLFTDPDALDGVASGAVNMTALGHNPHADKLPLLCSVPDFAPNSVQNALDYFDYLLFKNPASSAALQAEATANNVKYLGALAGGANAFVANFDFANLTELIATSRAFGNMEAAKFSALGFSSVEAVLPWDLYTSFSTGGIDATQMASTSMLQDGVAEVTSCWMYDNTYTAGNFMTVNLDWWNGLTADQQDVIQKAVDATAAHSVEVYVTALESEAKTLTDMGITIAEMTDAEFDQWWSVIMESKASDALAKAEQNGNVAECEAVLQAVADYTSYNLDMDAAAAAGAAAASASGEPAGDASGEPSAEPAGDAESEVEIELNGAKQTITVKEIDAGDQMSKTLELTLADGTVVTGQIYKGQYTADNAADQAVFSALQAVREAASQGPSDEPAA